MPLGVAPAVAARYVRVLVEIHAATDKPNIVAYTTTATKRKLAMKIWVTYA